MTQRLYYDDAHRVAFTARITERLTVNGQPAVILDQTCFYPEGGGQPPDWGLINGVSVLDVQTRQPDRAVLHMLAGPVSGDEVIGEVDWPRRFDHMQHHSGQHILTQAFVQTAAAHTVGFHLGAESVTIDLDRADLTPAQIAEAEDLANAIVQSDVPVRAWFPSADEVPALDLRKVPEVNGALRVVAIGDFDLTACGGTHVARAGEIGQIKVIRADKHRGGTLRVAFRCGFRALHDYRQKNDILHALAAELTVGYWEIDAALARLRAENKQLHAELRAARLDMLESEAAQLRAAAPQRRGLRIITAAWAGRDAAELRILASKLVEAPGTAALLGAAGEKSHLVLARAADLDDLDMVPLLRGAISRLSGGEARGGGRPDFAQGGGPAASLDALQQVLSEVERDILA